MLTLQGVIKCSFLFNCKVTQNKLFPVASFFLEALKNKIKIYLGLLVLLGLCISQFQRCPSPPGISRAFAHILIPGVGHLKFYHCPGVGHLPTPGTTPGHLTR